MPWKQMDTLTQREDFIQDWLRRGFPMRGLCARYGIAPKTGYKWLHRFQGQGMSGLMDHPPVRQHQAHRTAPPVVKQILHYKYTYPFWGPRTIHLALQHHPPGGPVPAVSTIGEILKQHGLVKARKRSQRTPPHAHPLAHAREPNALWSADFKGQFKLGNGQFCYPLTVFDNYSRYLLACRGCAGPDAPATRQTYRELFETYGVPDAIRTDNGWPFAMNTLGGLTPLSVWLLKLGIGVERIAPGHPEQNGRHERMHRTLKQSTACPPAATMRAQQHAFNRFLTHYNEQRPHQGLTGGQYPAAVYRPCTRSYREAVRHAVSYPEAWTVRKVKHGGYIKLNGAPISLTRQLVGEYVGLEAFGPQQWRLYFAALLLGVVDERLHRVRRPV